jgi:multidrug efflux pump subunit AcrA (membrane-fusion protein)
LARTKELFENEISSLSELDEAETAKILADLALVEAREAKRLAQLDLNRAWAEVKIRTIQSPIVGVVVERFLSPGELVARTPIVKLAQLDPLRVEAFVPVRMLGKVKVGMVAEIQPEDPVGGRYSAKVSVVDQVVDAASGTFGIRLRLPNPNSLLQAGLKCRMHFPLQ